MECEMSKKANSQLIQNKSDKVIFDFLKDVKIRKEKCLVWRAQGKEKITAEVELSVIRKFNGEVVFNATSKGQLEKLRTVISGCEFTNVFVINKSVLFRSKIKFLDHEDKLVLHFPQMVAQAERRKSLRLIMEGNEECRIKLQHQILGRESRVQKFDKALYDLSAGGLAFVTNSAESKLFNVGDALPSLYLTIEGEEYRVPGKVVNLIPVEPGPQNKLVYGGHRICVEFLGLGPSIQEDIEIFVF